MSEDTVEMMPDAKRCAPQHLISMWTLLAGLTSTLGLYFYLASQGAPLLPDPGFEAVDGAEVQKGPAAFLGWLIFTPCLFLFYGLTLVWIRRVRELTHKTWPRLPAPELWGLPLSDPITRCARTGIWIIVLLVPMYELGHFARKHLKTPFYELCIKNDSDGCEVYRNPRTDAERLLRRHEGGKASHFSLSHLSANEYCDHAFRFGQPFGLTYFPALFPWLWSALSFLVLMEWGAILWFGLLETKLPNLGRTPRSRGSKSP